MYRIRNLVGDGYFSGYSSGLPGIPVYASAHYLSYEDMISAGEIAATLRNSHEQRVKVEAIAEDVEAGPLPVPEPIAF